MSQTFMKLADGWYIGQIDGDLLRSGFGSMSYQNGAYYEGSWVGDRREGYGKMLYANGNLYEGEFVGGKREGQGKLVYSGSRGFVLGNWVADRLEGHVQRFDEGKGFFIGEYKAGRKHGPGRMQKKNLEYCGEYYKGLKEGVFTFSTLKGERKLLVLYQRGVKKKVKVVKNPNFARIFGLEKEIARLEFKPMQIKSLAAIETKKIGSKTKTTGPGESHSSNSKVNDSIFSFKIENREWRAYSDVLERSNNILNHPYLAGKTDRLAADKITKPGMQRFSTYDNVRFLLESADLENSGSHLSFG